MPHKSKASVNWQPISEIPLIAIMIDGALDDTREHLETLAEARTQPHVLDDATLNLQRDNLDERRVAPGF